MDPPDPTFEPPREPAVPGAIAALRRFARPRPVAERCELCAAPLAERHEHLLEPAARKLLCACAACAVLFSSAQAARYRRVPRRIERLEDFDLDDGQWAALGVPISLAFFYHSTLAGHAIGVYPSPGGPIEAPLAGEAWDALVRRIPFLGKLEPDVEALLVHRVGGARDYYLAPIDECFRLVGLVRTHWRGLSGGTDVWRHVADFFQELARRSSPAPARRARA